MASKSLPVVAVAAAAALVAAGAMRARSRGAKLSVRAVLVQVEEILVGVDEEKRLARVLRRIDEVNAEDPNVEEGMPKELIYGQRMSEQLNLFMEGEAIPVELQVAARAQHIARWTSPRSSYPEGRAGYFKWRTDLYAYHGERARSIMLEEGFGAETCAKVVYLLSKKGIKAADETKRDPLSQALEDVICLVFLKYYWKPFIKRDDMADEAKLIAIVQRTWAKMSERGHAAALKLGLSGAELEIVQKALSA